MCGFAGFIDPRGGASVDVLTARVQAMTDRILHRGPDDEGAYVEPETGLALGFRRLAIQDLTADGAQPMTGHDGRYTIVFNGEIYNFHELRRRLETEGRAPTWRGHSDTEVLLACISAYGMDGALDLFDGMFAFALYDRQTRQLALARDRIGEKPLYYGRMGGVFLFASELKAMEAHPDWAPALNGRAAEAFIRYSYVPAPHSIFSDIQKLLPGNRVVVDMSGQVVDVAPYWDAQAVVAASAGAFEGSPDEAVAELERLLSRSIARRMIADVPLGAFLSGGIDSSAVVALMQAQSDQPVNSFTIGFEDKRFDESPHARAVSDVLGTHHTDLIVKGSDALDLVGRLPDLYDEPFGDVSALPTLLLSQLARGHVVAAMVGDGGDELFCGYPRYWQTAHKWQRKRGPQINQARLDALPFRFLNRLPSGRKSRPLGDKLAKSIADACAPSLEQLYEHGMTKWRTLDRPAPPTRLGYFAENAARPDVMDPLLRLMFADSQSYLPDQLLVKTDRASMSVSLELRAPLLARDVIEFAWSLPTDRKYRDGLGKWALRQVLYKHVPKEIIDRPKQGFEPPIGDWLRGPMRDWAEDLLQPDDLLDHGPVQRVWREHLSGRRNWHFELWNVLMLKAWRRRWSV